LVTPDFEYYNDRPHISLGFGNDLLTHIFHISNYSSNAIIDLRAINLRNNQVVERNLQLKYLDYENVLVDTYHCSNETTINGTIQENCEVNGTKEITQKVWRDFEGVDGEDYTLGIFADTKNKDYIDIAFNFHGIAVENSPINWASWDSDLETDLVSWYKLDETSGTIAYDSLGRNNLTNNGATINQSGKLVNSYLHDVNDYLRNSSTLTGIPTGASARTVCSWIYPTTASDNYVWIYGTASTRRFFGLVYYTSSKFGIIVNGYYVDSVNTFALNNWRKPSY
jgi:hypothetical protein